MCRMGAFGKETAKALLAKFKSKEEALEAIPSRVAHESSCKRVRLPKTTPEATD